MQTKNNCFIKNYHTKTKKHVIIHAHLFIITISINRYSYLRWCRLPELNQQPTDYKSVALPIELRRHFFVGGHYRDRTCDLFRVKEAFSR